jgi:rhamnose utilization protein RhaD (predicted bifunctional aldolase and dehydrogenase)
MEDDLKALVELSREMGRPEHRLAILAEGNTSVRLDGTRFAVKSSGASLATMTRNDVTVCDTARLTALLGQRSLEDAAVEEALLAARVDPKARKPSIESVFHAWLLTLPDVHFVGHCHPLSVNRILCSPRARDFAEHRMFPDEVVTCGPASVYVPYADPGLPLAWQIRERTRDFIRDHDMPPRLILLQNHGAIALGSSVKAVMAGLLMAEKAAEIFAGAAAMGGPTFLLPQHVDRILQRPDEVYRQARLGL